MSTYNQIEVYIRDAISHNGIACAHWGGNGPVAELERKLCDLYGAKHALCIDSATNGLLYMLLAAGLADTEILTTPLSFGGTIAGALALDCTFHFADIDDTLNISPAVSDEILNRNSDIQAVIAVDFAGNPHRMSELHAICKKRNVWHFVDAAQSLGAEVPNTQDYDAMVVSFGSGKTVFAGGEGGAIITSNTDYYYSLVSVCQHPHRQERDIGIGCGHEFALNGRMHPLAAVVACELFLDGLETVRKKREAYCNALKSLSTFDSVSSVFAQSGSAFYHCPFLVDDEERFQNEFANSALADDYQYEVAPFVPIPIQLVRVGLQRRIETNVTPALNKIIGRLYVLQKKSVEM